MVQAVFTCMISARGSQAVFSSRALPDFRFADLETIAQSEGTWGLEGVAVCCSGTEHWRNIPGPGTRSRDSSCSLHTGLLCARLSRAGGFRSGDPADLASGS